jgi:catechol 2,3-dioxygenase-like lactoylglutathione lyase family enzyme
MKYEPDHTGIIVSDVYKSSQWYINNLGFKEIKKFYKEQLRIKGATLQLNDFYLELIEPTTKHYPKKNFSPLDRLLEKIGTSHIAFSTEDVNLAYNNLKEDKVEMVTALIENRFFFCRDPDQNLLEIRQKK